MSVLNVNVKKDQASPMAKQLVLALALDMPFVAQMWTLGWRTPGSY